MKKGTSKKSSTPEGKPPGNGAQATPQTEDDFLVVGLGASAGGIKAFKEFFTHVPPDSGMAYVVILHLSPEHESHLAEVLQVATEMPVTQVRDSDQIKPNRIYVIPPNKSLAIKDGHLLLSKIERIEERRAPVDVFFRTLAESKATHAVCVVLSGTGPNGSMGLKRVKEMGGVCIVQDPQEAEYPDMPRNSMATGLVDYVLPVAEIPRKIIAYKERLKQIRIPLELAERPATDEEALRQIFTQLRVRTGHDFSNYKRATILRRIERRLNVNELPDLQAYVHYLDEHKNEAQALLKDLLISVTNFFRDCESFEALERGFIRQLFEGKETGDQVRVWVAGCATGEEAYTLAMLLCEFRESLLLNAPTVQIFATDIDEQAIAIAREGFYSEADVADISAERLHRFFTKEGSGYRIRREFREIVLFVQHNLIKDPPFSHLDLVSCRNLLIYLNRAAQERVMQVFHFALNPGGFLFLSTSESIDTSTDLFLTVDQDAHIYQSRAIAPRLPLPIDPTVLQRATVLGRRPKEGRADEARSLERFSYAELHQRLVEQYAPPSVVVNEKYDIVHLSERAGQFMQVTGGEPTHNLLRMVRPEIRMELRTALYQAVQKRVNVEARAVPVHFVEGTRLVNLSVRPVFNEGDSARGFILVIFEEAGEKTESSDWKVAETVMAADPAARLIEDELVRVKGHLRSTIEQYETQTEELKASNEELQAMNEELRSTAEELETSKEEFQSLNEELTTVNQELKIKIEELSQTNDDLKNLMKTTDIGTIFLDRALRLKFFTPRSRDIFNLLPADIGRSFFDITSQLADADLRADLEYVLTSLQPVIREVRTLDGRWYLMNISPYRTVDDRINGVILNFLNISERKQREEETRQLASRLEQQTRIFNTLLSSISDFAYMFDREGRFVYANQPLLDLMGISLEEIIGKNFFDLNYPDQFASKMQHQIKQVFAMKEAVRDETPFAGPTGVNGFYEYILTPILANDNKSVAVVAGSTRDVTKRKQAEEHLRESEARLRLIMESVMDFAILTMDTEGRITSWNVGAEHIFGYTGEEILGQPAEIIFTPEDRAAGVPEEEMKTAREEGRAIDERWHLRRNGVRFYVSGVLAPLYENNKLIGYTKIARDLTKQQRTEEQLRNAHDNLEHKVEERTRELAQANEALRKENAERRQIERARLQLLRQLVRVQEEERRRIARDLHDHLGQQSTALRLKLEALKSICEKYEELCAPIEQTQAAATQLDADVDFLAWELRPAALDDLGLAAALANFVKEWSKHFHIEAEFHNTDTNQDHPSPEVEINLYRIAQESLNNIAKHAQASRVDVLLEQRDQSLVLIIEDNGIGFDPNYQDRGAQELGLLCMQERASLVGGTLEIESVPNQGTTIFVRVPVSLPEEGAGEG